MFVPGPSMQAMRLDKGIEKGGTSYHASVRRSFARPERQRTMIPSLTSCAKGESITRRGHGLWPCLLTQPWLAGFICMTVLFGLIAVNRALPFPDTADFRGLGAICRLMDKDIRYCVNNNWGFAHPLSCWLLTKMTGDLFIGQRMLNALFTALYILLLIRILRYAYGSLSLRMVGCLLLFICSPWMVDAAVSTHLDIIPITLVFAAVSLILRKSGIAAYGAAGLMAGAAYWFRFHFLPLSMLFPLLACIIGKERHDRVRGTPAAAAGVLVAIAVPHILCLLAYGVFSVSNERFVLAEALGAVDWSYESAVKVSHMRTIDMFRSFDAKRFLLAYGYHFFTSGLFPLLLIAAIAVKDYFQENGKTIKAFFTGSDTRRRMLLFASAAAIAVIPFTLVRGFTYRLEAAFVLCAIPMAVGMVSGPSKKTARMAFMLALLGIAVQQVRFWPDFQAHKTEVVAIERIISQKIPRDVLANRPDNIICCVEYYNPYNKYKLCNPTPCAGWAVRFGPMIERLGLLNLLHPFENKTYANAEYLILPSQRDVFDYTEELLKRNRTLFRDKNMIILQLKEGG